MNAPRITRQAMYVWRNTEARSCNYCCTGKTVSSIYSECVCVCSLNYPACSAHAPYCNLWPARLYSISPHYVINSMIFRKNFWIWNVFWFSRQLSSKTFLILRRFERDMIRKHTGRHAMCLLFFADFKENYIFFFDKLSKNTPIQNFKTIRPVGTDLFHADIQMDSHDEANSHFAQFC